ncbi:nucleolar RNA helicase 2-like [Catharus ustulatus]|uniref:nucleolar RNA helicase 2-like n=1 Tax=Catharus ustulatus TaxID=91951 RepID=UPI00140B77D9|nr:nucleolar RNA helicase 2-like [Catharus ustulatus]
MRMLGTFLVLKIPSLETFLALNFLASLTPAEARAPQTQPRQAVVPRLWNAAEQPSSRHCGALSSVRSPSSVSLLACGTPGNEPGFAGSEGGSVARALLAGREASPVRRSWRRRGWRKGPRAARRKGRAGPGRAGRGGCMGAVWGRAARLGLPAARAAVPASIGGRWLSGLCGAGAGPLVLLAAALPRGPARPPHFLRAGAGRASGGHRAETDPGTGSSAVAEHLPREQPAAMPAAEPEHSPAEPQAPAAAESLRRGRRRKVKEETPEKKVKRQVKGKRRAKAEAEQAQPEEGGLGDGDLEPPVPKKTKKVKEKSNGLVGESDESQHVVKSSSAVSGSVTSPAAQSGEQDSEDEELTEEEKEGAFSNFPLSENTIKLLTARGVKYLFPVQVKTFQPIYDGKDVIAQARTGTGKTLSFALPLIEKLQSVSQDGRRGRAPKVLVLVPTRELAIQVAKDFKNFTKKLSIACFYGGSPYKEQLDHLKSGIDILVGTPGRIKDHIQNSKLELSKVKHVVLDEVDHMLDMGFAEQVEEILGSSYKKGSENNPQTLLFSATCPRWVYDVAKKYMRDEYEQIDLIGKKTQRTATTVEHLAIQCRSSQRAGVLGDIIQVYSGSRGRTIVFCETKREANELAMNASLKQDAQSLHGDIPQKQREITLKGFRNGVFEVLIATNVAARGLDIPEVDLVIQCSPPKDVDSYIHRSGRTGRAGRTGICICLFQRREEDLLKQVEHKAGITFKRVGVPSATDVIKASSSDAKKLLEAVPPSAVDYFRKSAEELIDEKGAVAALAAALAHISGAAHIQQRSLLNSTAGFVTMVLKCSIEMHTMGYAWRGLKEQLGEEIDNKASAMRFLKGKMGVCFDIPVDELSNIQERWRDTRRWQLSVASELPELEEFPQEAGQGFSRFKNRQGNIKRNSWFKNGNRGL